MGLFTGDEHALSLYKFLRNAIVVKVIIQLDAVYNLDFFSLSWLTYDRN